MITKTAVETRERPDKILYTKLCGIADAPMMEAVTDSVSPYIERADSTDWIIDATDVTDIGSELPASLSALLRSVKARNGRHIAFVSELSKLRLAVVTASFAESAGVVLADTLAEAEEVIATRRAED